jgi:hypothetical protein
MISMRNRIWKVPRKNTSRKLKRSPPAILPIDSMAYDFPNRLAPYFRDNSTVSRVNKNPDKRQKNSITDAEKIRIPAMPAMLPTGNTIFFKNLIINTVSMGNNPRRKKPDIYVLFFLFAGGLARPISAPVLVNSIQQEKIIPITSSFPLKTERNSLRNITWEIRAVNPSAINGRLSRNVSLDGASWVYNPISAGTGLDLLLLALSRSR